MRWTPKGRSRDLRDQRGGGGRRGGAALPVGGGLVGVVVLVVFVLLGGDPSQLQGVGGGGGTDPGAAVTNPEDEEQVLFVSFVLDDAQDEWAERFQAAGRTYDRAELTLFTGGVSTGCGQATSAVGPFYCPPDQGVYLDLDFFSELSRRFGAPGDFAQAYVIAHEIGHHVQTITGAADEFRAGGDANQMSILQELQADCLAGVWGATAEADQLLSAGDLEEGLGAAAAVGDDRIQEAATGQTNPESWTHGSAEQRTEWFRRGFDTGDEAACDTLGNGSPLSR